MTGAGCWKHLWISEAQTSISILSYLFPTQLKSTLQCTVTLSFQVFSFATTYFLTLCFNCSSCEPIICLLVFLCLCWEEIPHFLSVWCVPFDLSPDKHYNRDKAETDGRNVQKIHLINLPRETFQKWTIQHSMLQKQTKKKKPQLRSWCSMKLKLKQN